MITQISSFISKDQYMNKYHLLIMFLNGLCTIQNIFSCPCTSSPKDTQPFFEQYDESANDEQAENEKKEEVSS